MGSKFSSNGKRTLVIIASLLLLGSLFFPIWKIDLAAPQYPEGLTLKIWAYKLAGNIDTVNGLNHYIGMKTLHEEEFVEFKVLPYLLVFFSLFGVITGFLNNRKILYVWMSLFLIFAVFSMVDFYYWEYNYGHNLDPTAPIQVPGMAYQPPFLGYKQMLNFGAFSIPDIGGWFFIGSGVIMFLLTFMEWKYAKKQIVKRSALTVASFILFFTFASCNNEVKPIHYGKSECNFCKMTIVDKKFAVEIITKKGKVFMMDDLGCAERFIKNGDLKTSDISEVYINNFIGSGDLINMKTSVLVKNEKLASPMGGHMAAFPSKTDADNYISENGGTIIQSESVIPLK